MCKLIIAGHGSYGTSIRRSLHMIFGETEGIFFIDFTEEDLSLIHISPCPDPAAAWLPL